MLYNFNPTELYFTPYFVPFQFLWVAFWCPKLFKLYFSLPGSRNGRFSYFGPFYILFVSDPHNSSTHLFVAS